MVVSMALYECEGMLHYMSEACEAIVRSHSEAPDSWEGIPARLLPRSKLRRPYPGLWRATGRVTGPVLQQVLHCALALPTSWATAHGGPSKGRYAFATLPLTLGICKPSCLF